MHSLKEIKVTTLAENLVLSGGPLGQWGFSALIEAVDARGDPRRVLLDTSANAGAFLHNVKELKADLSSLDAVVLSHGHYDHASASVEAVKLSGGARVYAHPEAFLPHFAVSGDGKKRLGGVPEGQGVAELEAAGGEVRLSREPVEVVPGLWTTGEVPRRSFELAVAPPTRFGTVVDGVERFDQVPDDLSLWARVEGWDPWVVSGCAHAGLLNILDAVERQSGSAGIGAFIGGTHLVGRDDAYVERTFQALKPRGIRLLSPCHCTAFKATTRIMNAYPDSFVLNYCGRVIESGKTPEPRVI